jgi:tetratricopeptide (TPR) repeat protein
MAAQSFCLYVVGRLRGVTRGRLALAAEAAGGRLVRTISGRVDLVALSHGSALRVLAEAPPPRLPAGIPERATTISEVTLRRRLGLLHDVAQHRAVTGEEIQRASGLGAEVVRCLALYDVLEPVDGLFSFRDVRVAREARRLLDHGFGLDEIAEASIALRRSGRGLFDTSVAEAPWGELMQWVGGRLGRLDGQFVLPLEEDCADVDEIFAQAEQHEFAGNLEEAERLYGIALRMDRTDPVIPFNLGNVLDAQGRPGEAVLHYRQALGRDATFGEAWINIAALQETAGRSAEAEASLRRALETRPDFDQALYNLALLMTRAKRYAEALPIWEQYLAVRPLPQKATTAMRLRALCRFEGMASFS